MELSKAQEKKLREFIDKNLAPATACPICDKEDWTIPPRLYECREFLGGSINIGGGSIVPLVLMRCDHCGHTLFFNAISAGIIEPQKGRKRDQKET